MTSQLSSQKITDKEYIEAFQPIGVWLLIEKDVLPEKTSGGIILATKARENTIKWSGTGYIRGIAPANWAVFEQGHDAYWRQMFRIGDHVGFSTQTPILAPAPPQWHFVDSGETGSTRFVQITFTDITGIFLKTEQEREEWKSRLDVIDKGGDHG